MIQRPYDKYEYAECADYVHFMCKHIKIKNNDDTLSVLSPYPHQIDIVKRLYENDKFINLSDRQCGTNIACISYILHKVCYNKNVKFKLLFNKNGNLMDEYNKINTIFKEIPLHIKPGIVTTDNIYNTTFDNGCEISFELYGSNYDVIDTSCELFLFDYGFSEYSEPLFKLVTETNIKAFAQCTGRPTNIHFIDLYKRAKLHDNHPNKLDFNHKYVSWCEIPTLDNLWYNNLKYEAGFAGISDYYDVDF